MADGQPVRPGMAASGSTRSGRRFLPVPARPPPAGEAGYLGWHEIKDLIAQGAKVRAFYFFGNGV